MCPTVTTYTILFVLYISALHVFIARNVRFELFYKIRRQYKTTFGIHIQVYYRQFSTSKQQTYIIHTCTEETFCSNTETKMRLHLRHHFCYNSRLSRLVAVFTITGTRTQMHMPSTHAKHGRSTYKMFTKKVTLVCCIL